ncbi:MAG: hypothetical protein BWY75_03332 [bacterium ADurb.Bin425]|nr:MAG: hypothetical protein BWY75_03332 [bacterium ADurb.Bin425]
MIDAISQFSQTLQGINRKNRIFSNPDYLRGKQDRTVVGKNRVKMREIPSEGAIFTEAQQESTSLYKARLAARQRQDFLAVRHQSRYQESIKSDFVAQAGQFDEIRAIGCHFNIIGAPNQSQLGFFKLGSASTSGSL